MKSPDKTLYFFYRSVPMKLNRDIWIVRVTLPPNAVAETPMSVHATDGDEKPLESAVFEFMGQRVDIKDGEGSLTFGDFVKGMGEKSVWMFRPGLEPVPGGLTFG